MKTWTVKQIVQTIVSDSGQVFIRGLLKKRDELCGICQRSLKKIDTVYDLTPPGIVVCPNCIVDSSREFSTRSFTVTVSGYTEQFYSLLDEHSIEITELYEEESEDDEEDDDEDDEDDDEDEDEEDDEDDEDEEDDEDDEDDEDEDEDEDEDDEEEVKTTTTTTKTKTKTKTTKKK